MADQKIGRITQLTHERGAPPYFRVIQELLAGHETVAPNTGIRQAILDGAIYGLNADTVITEMSFMIVELMQRVAALENQLTEGK